MHRNIHCMVKSVMLALKSAQQRACTGCYAILGAERKTPAQMPL